MFMRHRSRAAAPATTKRCTGPCGTVWNINDFNKRTASRDKRQAWCFKCQSKYNAWYRKTYLLKGIRARDMSA